MTRTDLSWLRPIHALCSESEESFVIIRNVTRRIDSCQETPQTRGMTRDDLFSAVADQ